jgi:hypothetical protein
LIQLLDVLAAGVSDGEEADVGDLLLSLDD